MLIYCRVGLVLAFFCLSSTGSTQTATCGSSSDSGALATLSGVKALASGSDASFATWRAIAKMPQSPASSVSLVSTDSVCVLAANALAQLSGQGPATYPVWVIAIGPTRYLVFDKLRSSAGKLLGAVMDGNMTWLTDIVL